MTDANMDTSEILTDLTGDLVELKRHKWFLERLFSLASGEWQKLTVLCREESDVTARLSILGEDGDSVYVTWLDFPSSVYGNGYRTIIFFSERVHWHNVALYNTAALRDG